MSINLAFGLEKSKVETRNEFLVLKGPNIEWADSPSRGEELSPRMNRKMEKAMNTLHLWFEHVRQIEDRDKKEREMVKLVNKLNRRIDRALKITTSTEDAKKLTELKVTMSRNLDEVKGKSATELDAFATEVESRINGDPGIIVPIMFWVGLASIIALIVIIIV